MRFIVDTASSRVAGSSVVLRSTFVLLGQTASNGDGQSFKRGGPEYSRVLERNETFVWRCRRRLTARSVGKTKVLFGTAAEALIKTKVLFGAAHEAFIK